MRIAMLALAIVLGAAEARAAEFQFNLRNCQARNIDVKAYNARDTIAQWIPYSSVQGLKYGQSASLACDEQGRGYCLVLVTVDGDTVIGRDPLQLPTRVVCFDGHRERAIELYGDCSKCPS